MPVITNIIPEQPVELVRNRVAEILLDELDNQVSLFMNYDLDVDVDVESQNPYVDKVDMPLVSVSVLKGNLGNKHQGQQDGKYQLAVEVFTNAKSTAAQKADQRATFHLHKIMGAVRYILEDPKYKWLGYVQNTFIIRTFLSDFIIYESKKDDANCTIGGRWVLNFEVVESNTLITPQLADGYLTKAKLYLTAQGYKWDYIQYS